MIIISYYNNFKAAFDMLKKEPFNKRTVSIMKFATKLSERTQISEMKSLRGHNVKSIIQIKNNILILEGFFFNLFKGIATRN